MDTHHADVSITEKWRNYRHTTKPSFLRLFVKPLVINSSSKSPHINLVNRGYRLLIISNVAVTLKVAAKVTLKVDPKREPSRPKEQTSKVRGKTEDTTKTIFTHNQPRYNLITHPNFGMYFLERKPWQQLLKWASTCQRWNNYSWCPINHIAVRKFLVFTVCTWPLWKP